MVTTEALPAQADRDLERRVENFLRRQHFPGLRSIQVESDHGVVTIRGRVGSYHERQLCINCCQRVAGVVRLNDEVEVLRESAPIQRRPNLAIFGERPRLTG